MSRVQFSNVEYLGGYPDVKPASGRVLIFDDDGVHLRALREQFVIPWADVTAAAVEGPEETQKRLTATRVLGMGIFALAAKKKTSQAVVQVDTAGYSVGFVIPKSSAGEVKGKVIRWLHGIPEPGAAPPASSPSMADELRKLAELRDSGVLSDAEFEAQKARLLG